MTWQLVALCMLGLAHAQDPVASTQYGDVVGTKVHVGAVFDDWNYMDVDSFLAVPFGGNTFDFRFKKPQPPQSWTSPRSAQTLGAACPHLGQVTWITHFGWDNFNEDCLHMNIIAPTDKSGGPYPVMIFFHGGAFQTGSNIQYPGYFLASRGVIAVAANYRLGNFGFPYSGTDDFPGNAGMHDQVLALEFIQANIANFGGDPNRVTVFGQSAGAASTSHHVVSPLSKHLFHQAIMESGTESNFWSINWPGENPTNYLTDVATQAGCPVAPTPNWPDVYQCMLTVPWETLINITVDCTPGWFCLGMAPVVDGVGGFLPNTPELLRDSGEIMKGNIITGFNRDDGSLYTIDLIPETLDGPFNREMFQDAVRNNLLSMWDPHWGVNQTEDIFQAFDWNYSPWDHMYESDWDYRHNLNEMITDGGFGAATNRQALKTASLPEKPAVFTYIYGFRGANTATIIPEWMGVPHMLEIPYVFGLPLIEGSPEVREDSGVIDIIVWTAEDIEHAKFFITMLTNFVKFGDPTPMPVMAPSGELVIWPQYVDGARNFLSISNTSVHTEVDWHQKDYAFFLHYMDYLDGDSDIPIYKANKKPSGMKANRMEKMIENILIKSGRM